MRARRGRVTPNAIYEMTTQFCFTFPYDVLYLQAVNMLHILFDIYAEGPGWVNISLTLADLGNVEMLV